MMRTLPWEAIVIGAGFAGASTAWWLRRRGLERILILEKEAAPGRRASGQNAGIARLAVSDGATARLTSRGGAFLRNPPDGFSEEPLFEPTGGILLCGMAEGLEEIRLASEPAGIRLTALDRRGVLDLIPFLEDSPFRAAYHCPDDGLVDIHAYLGAFLRGSSLRVKEEVREAAGKQGGKACQRGNGRKAGQDPGPRGVLQGIFVVAGAQAGGGGNAVLVRRGVGSGGLC